MTHATQHRWTLIICCLAALAAATAPAVAEAQQAVDAADGPPLTVAVREVPPFASRDSAGNWEGLSVDLWQDVADRLDLTFRWREVPIADTWDALGNGDVDVAIAALSITVEREQRFDFSFPYYVSGLSPAYAQGAQAWFQTLKGFASWQFLSAVGSLALVLLAAGFLIWIFERKANAEEFGGNAARGLGDGFWWSAVTMTTVGYGDKAPKTLGGRIVALIWMFMSLIIIASFTASIAASLTANQLASDELRSRPIGELRVAVKADTAAQDYVASQGAEMRTFAELEEALQALADGRVEAVVHDAPILQQQVQQSFDGIVVHDRVLVRDDYAFALPAQSPLREPINVALLSILHEPVWQEIRRRYLGTTGDAR